jgi:serine protease Do
VVNVAVTSKAEEQPVEMQGAGPQGLPPGLEQFFGNGGGRQMPQQPEFQHGIGSGVIISPDGYIVTNNHVVDGATQIKVTLHDRRRLNAKVIGVDKLTDLAVIKVDAQELPAMSWGDSSKLQPGQTVLAFGSPFGYFQFSVTRGIVSAVNRQNPYSDDARKLGGYIQTDAAINPGNSGGPLVDSTGAVVGINTAIRSLGAGEGGSIGLGFAIPIDEARSIAQELIRTGVVRHAEIGINARSVNDGTTDGAQVQNVQQGGAAAAAGIVEGDVIVRVGDRPIAGADELVVAVRERNPGDTVPVELIRDGRQLTLSVVLTSD